MRSLHLSMLAAAVVLAGCSSMRINTEYDPAAPFATYKTYAWIATAPGPEQAAPVRNPQLRAVVVSAIDREMTGKGLTRVTADSNPDFLVSVIGWSHTKVDVTTYGYSYGAAYAYGPSAAVAMPMPITEVREYAEGTLLLDFVDARTKRLVWRGTASDAIETPEAVVRKIDEAARQLMAAYPPRT